MGTFEDLFAPGGALNNPYRNTTGNPNPSPSDTLPSWLEWTQKYGPFASNTEQPIVKGSDTDAIQKLANELNVKLDSTTKDYLTQYYFADKASENAYNRELRASSTQYQRAVEDLKKAGLNPFLAFDSLRGAGANSSAGSISGGLLTQKENNRRENTTKAVSSIMSILGIIAAAVIYAL